jgi:hypothetical protein
LSSNYRFAVKREKVDTEAVKLDRYVPQGSYAGDWHKDKRDGFGTQVFASGDKCVWAAVAPISDETRAGCRCPRIAARC